MASCCSTTRTLPRTCWRSSTNGPHQSEASMAEISITKTKRDRAEACRALRRNDQKRAKDSTSTAGSCRSSSCVTTDRCPRSSVACARAPVRDRQSAQRVEMTRYLLEAPPTRRCGSRYSRMNRAAACSNMTSRRAFSASATTGESQRLAVLNEERDAGRRLAAG